jgi:thiamine-monophosphate kinase
LGIGDDCAVLEGAGGKYLLVTTDMLVEDVHFSRAYSSIREIGQKAMIVNISDIAAMAGEPRFAFISLALPASLSLEDFDELWQGMAEVAQKYSLLILGGDTNASFPRLKEYGLVINITLIGEVWPDRVISRQGARPGDLILLTGQLGDSAAGLDLLQSYGESDEVSTQIDWSSVHADGPVFQDNNQYLHDFRYQQALQRHRVPVVRLAESRIIGQRHLATAMIDVSDGLAGDLRHLCNQSHLIHQGQQGKVGAVLWSDRIPISGAVTGIARLLQKSALSYALSGGEDYELLFTSPPDLAEKARQMIEQETGTPVSIIGEITEEAKGIHLIDTYGQVIPIPESGFDHFR